MSRTRPFVAALALGLALLAPRPAQAQWEPFLGQLMLVGFNYCPNGWMEANGQLLSIAQDTALFALLGTTYGGDGKVTFGLPDLRGRAPIHEGQGPGLTNRVLGEASGQEQVTLHSSQMPAHAHALLGTTAAADAASPTNAALATKVRTTVYKAGGTPNTLMQGGSVGPAGGSQPHENMPPYLVMKWCIAVEGIFPSQSFTASPEPAAAKRPSPRRRTAR